MTCVFAYDCVMNANRYEIDIDATDLVARAAVTHHFTDVSFAPAPESASLTVVTFTATDAALDAYADEFGFDHDEFRDDVIAALD